MENHPTEPVPPPRNLFELPPATGPSERFDTLASHGGIRVERILSHGHATDGWYDQACAEWVCVLEGAATLELLDPDETLSMIPGDWLWIPAHRRHRVTRTASPTVWLAVHWPSEA